MDKPSDKPSDMPRKLGYTLTSIAHETKVPVRTLRDWFYYRPSAFKALVIGAVKIINDRDSRNSNAETILSEIKGNMKFQARILQNSMVQVTSYLQHAIDFIQKHEHFLRTEYSRGYEIYHMKDGSRILRDGEDFYIDQRTTKEWGES